MPSVSPIKTSPIAKYLTENKAKAYKLKDGYVEFKNADNKLLGKLFKSKNPIQQYSSISIDLFKPEEEIPFVSQHIVIENIYRYFLKEHKFMPVNIEIEKTLKDWKHNISNKETITRGLASNLYIEQLKESEELKAERQKLGTNIPDNFPIYKINKPFKYEFKAHLYYTQRPIDPSKPMIKD